MSLLGNPPTPNRRGRVNDGPERGTIESGERCGRSSCGAPGGHGARGGSAHSESDAQLSHTRALDERGVRAEVGIAWADARDGHRFHRGRGCGFGHGGKLLPAWESGSDEASAKW